MTRNKQIGKGSLGIQADRDVTVNLGLAVEEVETLTKLFLEENFPKLRQDAAEAARENVQKMLSEFEAQLSQRLPRLDVGRFRDPDVQFSLNEAVLATAKRGSAANIDLLVTLVLERVATDAGDLLSLACSDAVTVVPRLTKPQIDFLSVAFFLEHMSLPELSAITDYETSARMAQPILSAASRVSGWDEQYLESQRCLVHLHIGRGGIYERLKLAYPTLKEMSQEQIKKDIMEKTCHLRALVRVYEKHRMNFMRLTLVGILVPE